MEPKLSESIWARAKRDTKLSWVREVGVAIVAGLLVWQFYPEEQVMGEVQAIGIGVVSALIIWPVLEFSFNLICAPIRQRREALAIASSLEADKEAQKVKFDGMLTEVILGRKVPKLPDYISIFPIFEIWNRGETASSVRDWQCDVVINGVSFQPEFWSCETYSMSTPKGTHNYTRDDRIDRKMATRLEPGQNAEGFLPLLISNDALNVIEEGGGLHLNMVVRFQDAFGGIHAITVDKEGKALQSPKDHPGMDAKYTPKREP